MNESSPLVPQGSMLEQKNRSRAKFRVAVFCVIGVHVVGLMALLLTQGCKREQSPPTGDVQPPLAVDTNLPSLSDTNLAAYPDTNAYVMPTNGAGELPHLGTATEHVIVKGDTLSELAKTYHTTVKAIEAVNPTVNASKLQIGQKIMIPAPTAPAPGGATAITTADTHTASGEITHKVVSGDNLTKIAEKYKVTVNAIRKANNLTSDRIVVGQTLKIPAKTTTP